MVSSFDRDLARARVIVGTVLPLLVPVSRARPDLAKRMSATRGTLQIEASGVDLGARLHFTSSGLRVEPATPDAADVRCVFDGPLALARFFSGQAALPRLSGAASMASARLLAESVRLLAALRILQPPSARARAKMSRDERALRVALVLELVVRALSQLHAEGWPPLVALAEASPERVYQWSVGDAPIAVFLRMKDGRVHSGRGVYDKRAPFVHVAFPDVDAAFEVMMATDSSMEGFRGGRVETFGSPEYARKMALLMQMVDALLQPDRD
jgi:hypothetical protein